MSAKKRGLGNGSRRFIGRFKGCQAAARTTGAAVMTEARWRWPDPHPLLQRGFPSVFLGARPMIRRQRRVKASGATALAAFVREAGQGGRTEGQRMPWEPAPCG